MRLPFTNVSTIQVRNDPMILYNYDIIIIDYPCWDGEIPSSVISALRNTVSKGARAVFTDIALLDGNRALS